MWANEKGNPKPQRIELRGRSGADVARHFSTEVGIGQYGITVQDNANGMATFAAGGKRADAHFVRSVAKGDDRIYGERLVQSSVGLDEEGIDQLNWTLRQVKAAKLDNGWDSAGKTGTWQAGESLTRNVHTWMVGYTGALAAAVWLGTVDGKPLRTKDGDYDVFGATGPAPIWRQFMEQATAALKLDPDKYRFSTPQFPDETPSSTDRTTPASTVSQPSPTTAQPTPSVTRPSPTTARPSPTVVRPTCDQDPCVTSSPTPTRSRSPRPSPSEGGAGGPP
jgi:membrane peptidoglycan carboxypeptidase